MNLDPSGMLPIEWGTTEAPGIPPAADTSTDNIPF